MILLYSSRSAGAPPAESSGNLEKDNTVDDIQADLGIYLAFQKVGIELLQQQFDIATITNNDDSLEIAFRRKGVVKMHRNDTGDFVLSFNEFSFEVIISINVALSEVWSEIQEAYRDAKDA
jgi:hypothetical protein